MMKERERIREGKGKVMVGISDTLPMMERGERERIREGKGKVMVGKSDSLPMTKRGKGEDGEKGKEREKWWGVYQTHC